MNKIIPVGGTVVSLGMAAATATVGNAATACVFVAVPAVYWTVVLTQRAKRISEERHKAKMHEIEAEYARLAKEREERRAKEGLQTRSQAQERYAAEQRQQNAWLRAQMDSGMGHLSAQQMAARQQQAAEPRYGMGYSDPRASQGMGLADMFLVNAISNSLSDALSTGTGVTRTRVEETGAVRVDHVPARDIYRSADPEPERSSSSSSSSDTSSDSFSSSDTGSDSF